MRDARGRLWSVEFCVGVVFCSGVMLDEEMSVREDSGCSFERDVVQKVAGFSGAIVLYVSRSSPSRVPHVCATSGSENQLKGQLSLPPLPNQTVPKPAGTRGMRETLNV